jgi:hypothetical protein
MLLATGWQDLDFCKRALPPGHTLFSWFSSGVAPPSSHTPFSWAGNINSHVGAKAPGNSQHVESSSTASLKAQTNKLSRSYTLFAALRRLELLPTEQQMDDVQSTTTPLVIHVVGSDYREGNSPQETLEVFRTLFHLLLLHMSASDRKMRVVLLLIGPNVVQPLNGTEHKCELTLDNIEVKTVGSECADGDCRGARLEVCVQYVSELYHDYHQGVSHHGSNGGSSNLAFQAPNLCVCFQAGVWGYPDWAPTIALLVSLAPVVITSYNANEADDDWGTLEELLDMTAVRWLWEPEVNQFRSLEVRKSSSLSTLLAENSFWQCITAVV